MSSPRGDNHPLAERFLRFQQECLAHDSPLYARLAAFVATRGDLLDIAAHAPTEPRPNLFFGGVHHILLRGAPHALAAYYPSLDEAPRDDAGLFEAFEDFCARHRSALVTTMRTRIVQTNEVRRAACFLPCFHTVHAQDAGRPLALVEMGTSAGLLLAFDRYRYEYSDGRTAGPAGSALTLTCRVRGNRSPPVPSTMPEILVRRGIDLHPVEPDNEDDVQWLRALVWPEHALRVQRLEQALAVSRSVPIERIRGDATRCLPQALDDLDPSMTVCFFHSSTINHLTAAGRDALGEALARSSRARPVHELAANGLHVDWITHRGDERTERRLATYDSHGRWLEWHA